MRWVLGSRPTPALLHFSKPTFFTTAMKRGCESVKAAPRDGITAQLVYLETSQAV
jgi:hypothetical protein